MTANWLERLVGETRVQLLFQLRRAPRSITELARALGLTDNAVRTHVAALGRDGLVEGAGSQRDTGGKPARTYRLTTAGEELFPKAYSLVLDRVVLELLQQEGPAQTVAVLRAAGRRLAGDAPQSADAERRIEAAAAALRGLGGEVEVQQTERGWALQGIGCPLSEVTSRHAEVCAVATAVVEAITGLATTECCTRGERPRCRFQVDRAATS